MQVIPPYVSQVGCAPALRDSQSTNLGDKWLNRHPSLPRHIGRSIVDAIERGFDEFIPTEPDQMLNGGATDVSRWVRQELHRYRSVCSFSGFQESSQRSAQTRRASYDQGIAVELPKPRRLFAQAEACQVAHRWVPIE